MTGPTWQAATAGQPPLVAHVNQLLGTHALQMLYTGTETSSQGTAGSGNATSNGLWIAQQFTTGSSQTAIGYVGLNLNATTPNGANLAPWTVSIYANSAGLPSGPALVTTTATAEYVTTTPAVVIIPTPASGLAPSTTYWIVTTAAGNATYYYEWAHSNQSSGAATSTNGTTWTAQAYGLLYQVWDQTPILPLVATWEDGGARWTTQWTNPAGQITILGEYTAGQTTSGYLQSIRDLTYSNNVLTGVA